MNYINFIHESTTNGITLVMILMIVLVFVVGSYWIKNKFNSIEERLSSLEADIADIKNSVQTLIGIMIGKDLLPPH